MLSNQRSITIATLLLTLTAPRLVTGQEIAGSMEQLRVLVKRGDQVRVIDVGGLETRGKIVDLSAGTLALLVDGQRREVIADDISTIRQRRSDTLATGAKVGFGIGAGLGLLVALQLAAVYDEVGASAVVAAALGYGALGAGIGVAVDAAITREQVIYAVPQRTAATGRGVRLRPLLTRARQGVVFSVNF
jgi:hypothetical protein